MSDDMQGIVSVNWEFEDFLGKDGNAPWISHPGKGTPACFPRETKVAWVERDESIGFPFGDSVAISRPRPVDTSMRRRHSSLSPVHAPGRSVQR